MKRRPVLAFGALLAAAGISVGAFFAAKDKKEKDDKQKAADEADMQLFSFDSSNVTKINFNCADGDFTVELDEEDGWELSSGGDFALDQTYIQNVCTYAGNLQAEASYSNDESQLASYGLDSPTVIELFTDDDSYKINIGTLSPTQDYYYVSVDGKDKVYTIDSLYGSVLRANHLMLRSKTLVPYKSGEIARITMKKGDEITYDLTHDIENDRWSLPPEYASFEVNQTKAHSLSLVLPKVQAALDNLREADPSEISQYGLDKPTYTAIIKGADGTERNILVNSNFDPEKGYSCVYVKETGQIMLFANSDLSFVERTYLTFVVDSVVLSDITSSPGFDLKTGDLDIKLELDYENKNASINGNSVDLSDSSVNNSFLAFFNAVATENITSLDLDSKPELKDPQLTAVLRDSDGKELTYQLTDAGNEKSYVFIDGKYTGALVSSDIVSGLNSVPYFYKQFTEKAGLDK